MSARYRWYSVGLRPHGDDRTVEILGWSRDRLKAMAVKGTIEAYYASSREMAARKAKARPGLRDQVEEVLMSEQVGRTPREGVQTARDSS